MPNDHDIAAGAEAIRALNRRLAERDGPTYRASPEDQARAVLEALVDNEPLLDPDPRFPERPHTLDFARLSSAAGEMDAVADMLSFDEALGCDMESLLYIAKGRAGLSFGGPHMVKSAHLAIYFDAFQLGVGFQKKGGHRPNETGTAGEGSSS